MNSYETKSPPPATAAEKKRQKYVQQVLGSILYYARKNDLIILHALSATVPEQSKPAKYTLARVHQLLDYMATTPNAIVRFYASGTMLNLHLDASHLSAGQGRSRAGGYFFL